MRRLFAFLGRDFRIESSYRFAFLLNFSGILLSAITFFFISELIGEAASPYLSEFNGDYFSFVIIGIAFSGYFGVGLNSFARTLREAQTTGTLEAMIMSPTSVSTIIVGSALWSYVLTTIRVFLYLLIGVALFTLNLDQANYAAALVTLILAIVAFASIGIIAAAVIMVVKRGEPLTILFGTVANLVGGIYYPVEILPDWLQIISRLIPVTYALRAMRMTLLAGASWYVIWPDLLALVLFIVVLLPLSLFTFRYAVERARREGTLAHF